MFSQISCFPLLLQVVSIFATSLNEGFEATFVRSEQLTRRVTQGTKFNI
jgi:hypothetical protein